MKKIKIVKKIAEELHIMPETVRRILKEQNIEIKSSQKIAAEENSKPVFMLKKNSEEVLQSFSSAVEAARYLIDNKLTNCKFTTIRYHISEVCNNKRKSAAGFSWRY